LGCGPPARENTLLAAWVARTGRAGMTPTDTEGMSGGAPRKKWREQGVPEVGQHHKAGRPLRIGQRGVWQQMV
jgi:hypothetical protein